MCYNSLQYLILDKERNLTGDEFFCEISSFKLLAHIERWKNIRRGRPVPAPVLITVDPANMCDLNCEWCNARYIRDHRNRMITEKTLCGIADFLPTWGSSGTYPPE